MTDCVEHSCLGTSINSNAHPFEWQNPPNLVRVTENGVTENRCL